MSDGRFIIQTFVARARRSVRMTVRPRCLLRNRIIRNAGSLTPPPLKLRLRCAARNKQITRPFQLVINNYLPPPYLINS